jgi:adenylosuccinate lyase
MNTLDQIPVPKRYLGREMAAIWSEQAKYRDWARVEIAAAKAQGASSEATEAMARAQVPTPDAVAEEEATTGHDVMAFLAAWRRNMHLVAHGWVHRNMTSSDLVDSAMSLAIANSWTVIDRRMDKLVRALAGHALEHRNTLRIGRTHGQAAEVTTWGYKVADVTFAMVRAHSLLRRAGAEAVTPKLSGPVGDYKRISHDDEAKFAHLLLGPSVSAPITATQVVFRDSIAHLVYACAQAAAVIESLAMEVRLSMRTEVGELVEGGADRRQGSSAMPHKRNPIVSENLSGLARLVRAQVGPTLEDIALHHERDISHSSVERIALPTALILLDTMVNKATGLIGTLEVRADRMSANAYDHEPEVMSATARTWLVEKGLDPMDAWHVVKAAVDNCDAGSRLAAEVAREARHRVKTGDLDDTKFNPNWVELHEVCRMTVGNTDHVFDRLSRMLGVTNQ